MKSSATMVGTLSFTDFLALHYTGVIALPDYLPFPITKEHLDAIGSIIEKLVFNGPFNWELEAIANIVKYFIMVSQYNAGQQLYASQSIAARPISNALEQMGCWYSESVQWL